jgi:glycosyltransferase involved in cell wall biosynthesis
MPQAGGVAVVIPTFNEAESIGAVVAELPRESVDRIIVADGGSTDGTPDRARHAGADVVAVGRGYGLACLTGARAAESADIIVFMDGDGADDPAAIAALVAPIRAGRARAG